MDRVDGGDRVVVGGGVAGTRRSTASASLPRLSVMRARGCSKTCMRHRRVLTHPVLCLTAPNYLSSMWNPACWSSRNGWSSCWVVFQCCDLGRLVSPVDLSAAGSSVSAPFTTGPTPCSHVLGPASRSSASGAA
ncbi:hypothetical protein SKAU_G00056380 [Synaphobranchus kaupii]|uniref:Uncharacterized protein n=1 Tax=Synaphobranchus kaupii TaxID=118154 RepID=A0A9Q1G4W1_SYNKA|nr:hypothetical protein SKAU_G00056380 [Synaphobranchus kaupii]